jgi:hypothetical protein
MNANCGNGVLPASVHYIFNALVATKKFKAWCCCFEVYNERIYDLFDLKAVKEV